MKFSIIIPTYNRKDLLRRSIQSILNNNYKQEYEIIVVNDGSTDDTKSLQSEFPKSNIHFFNVKHGGSAKARNYGLKQAKGEYILFTDDDCIVSSNWLHMYEIFFRDHDIVGGAICNDDKRYIAKAQYFLNFSSWLPELDMKNVDDIPTANIGYKADIIDENYFPTNNIERYSDTIFNYNLRQKGKNILFVPEIKVTHKTWEQNYGLRKFFSIQKSAAKGFVNEGYKVHGKLGDFLMKYKFVNLLCPRIGLIAGRCIKTKNIVNCIKVLPLMFLGELYYNFNIVKNLNILKIKIQ